MSLYNAKSHVRRRVVRQSLLKSSDRLRWPAEVAEQIPEISESLERAAGQCAGMPVRVERFLGFSAILQRVAQIIPVRSDVAAEFDRATNQSCGFDEITDLCVHDPEQIHRIRMVRIVFQ